MHYHNYAERTLWIYTGPIYTGPRACNFVVSGPKFTKFFLLNPAGIVVNQVCFRFLTSRSVCKIFMVKLKSCLKSGWIFDFLALPNFWGALTYSKHSDPPVLDRTMGSKSLPSASVCNHSPDVFQSIPRPTGSSLNVDRHVFVGRPRRLPLPQGPWHGVIGWSSRSSWWYGLPSEVVSLLQCPVIFAAQSGLAPLC